MNEFNLYFVAVVLGLLGGVARLGLAYLDSREDQTVKFILVNLFLAGASGLCALLFPQFELNSLAGYFTAGLAGTYILTKLYTGLSQKSI